MLDTKLKSIQAIQTIAKALGDLNDKVMYVGGAVVAFYADDPGASEIRPTKDIDIVVQIVSESELEKFRLQLTDHNIHFAKDTNIMCRFKYKDIMIDVMATKNVGWAPTNPWFKQGYAHPEIHRLGDVQIKIMPVAYYLASKFTAYRDRGKDPRTSPDFEDIVYVLDNCTRLVDKILKSKNDVKRQLVLEFKHLLNDALFEEAIIAHLEFATQTQRYELLRQKLAAIIS